MANVVNTVLHRLSLPSMMLMSRLSLRTKLFTMSALLVFPSLLLVGFLLQRIQADISTADNELAGVKISSHLMSIMLETQKHRGQLNLQFAGSDMATVLGATRKELTQQLDEFADLHARHPQFALAAPWAPLQTELRGLANGTVAENSAASLAQHTLLISKILDYCAYAGEQTGLLLDPEAATYFLMDAATIKVPAWIENIAILRGTGAGHIKAGTLAPEQKAEMISRVNALQISSKAVSDLTGALQRSGESMPSSATLAFDASRQFIELARTDLFGATVSGDASVYFASGSAAIAKAVAAQKELIARLSSLLQQRANEQRAHRDAIVLLLVTAFCATLYLLWGFYHSFMLALHAVRKSAVAVASGDLTQQIHIHGKDELAETGNILESMNLNLSGLVANVRTNASMVSQLGQSLAAGIGDLSMRTEQQASSLEQT
ncbi:MULTISPECIES: HAMP domain-containing protein [unclassified Undibacterium]|uniref:HAMP domain-containing protein n=1 Tax=unclassified Undibacterium TaxID=2630295 RepID=UPI002AC950D2|nr:MULTISPECIES: HAMP domain-containing protein [unclassified Undibacterium]MEB0141062.1 HAMP domain-containing protein [Undibacterium sp. CCC2.1]MEB0174062.1 HAMP domain-containing protein [Undibacterium sp. CCC1.1]MEB0178022.1 HAMP domain-containing protein [Undibacterium sp. CCC3.4]MEB0217233.1 HAMP domain-containing protein [Undibacterium sp. 5I2]WPX45021.1 HAMP domain-containing protein [Undibacterium sp. CCC3.4]